MIRIHANIDRCVQLILRCYTGRHINKIRGRYENGSIRRICGPEASPINKTDDIREVGILHKPGVLRPIAVKQETGTVSKFGPERPPAILQESGICESGKLHELGSSNKTDIIGETSGIQSSAEVRKIGAIRQSGDIFGTNVFQNHLYTSVCIPNRLVATSSSHLGTQQQTLVLRKERPTVQQGNDHLSITTGHGSFKVSFLWLRDHCRCHECFEPICMENFVDIMAIPDDIRPKTVELDSTTITIVWHDNHMTAYDIAWLQENAPGQKSRDCDRDRDWDQDQPQPLLWNRERLRSCLPHEVSLAELRNGSGLARVIESLHVQGFVFVCGLKPTKESTEEAVSLIHEPMRTHYGEIWQFQNDGAINDSGFTSLALKTHTDHTAYHNAAGAVILHCISHDGEGGDNTLVDGWRAAEHLKETKPDHYRTLLETPYVAHYLIKNLSFRCCDTVLREHGVTGQLQQIRYNPHDRALLNYLPYEDADRFYAAYRSLGRIIESPDSQFVVKPRPGRMLVMDNWRILHGRTAFTGKRSVLTGYISHDDIQSLKRTVLKLDV